MFWFGDLNLWGAFPTTPTVYQKPRNQVFYMGRNWFERQVFLRQIILLRYALYNYGFELAGKDTKGTAAVQKWAAQKWFGLPHLQLIKRFLRDVWMEWLIQDNVVAVWRKRKGGARPLVYPVEHVSYSDDYGVERLGFAHGLSRQDVRLMEAGLDPEERKTLLQGKDINLVKQGAETTSDLFDFEVVKRSRFGFGLAWPQLRTVFNTVGAWESLELADWQLCDAMRTVYELHKVGHEIKNGPHAGSPQHFMKRTRREAVNRLIGNTKGTLATVKRLVVNFDHDITYPRPDPKQFAPERYTGMLDRLVHWSMPLGQMLYSKSVNPFLAPMLKAQAHTERELIGDFVSSVLIRTLGAPEDLRCVWSDDALQDARLLAETLKTGLTTGPLSDSTWLTRQGFDPEAERALKEEAQAHPVHQHLPIFNPGGQGEGGRPEGKKDGQQRKSEREG